MVLLKLFNSFLAELTLFDLHSTMVLLKWDDTMKKSTHLTISTFHYGSIKIIRIFLPTPYKTNLHSTMVLLKLYY